MEIIAMLQQRVQPRMPATAGPVAAIPDRFDAPQAGVGLPSPKRQAEAVRRAKARRAAAAGPDAWCLADDALARARRGMSSPAPLPSLSDALARRAGVFGPYDGDEVAAAPRGPAQALGALARRVVAALDFQRRS